jgi:kynureninase
MENPIVDTSRQYALSLYEREDELKRFKEEFFLPQGHLYFSAHQLGPLSKRVKQAILERLEQWEKYSNASWRLFKWLEIEDSVALKLAHIVHADP